MEVWPHAGRLYELTSWYNLGQDAWEYELSGLTGACGTGPYLAVVIPDATPEAGPFTPKDADHALVSVAGGVTPWPILRRLLDRVEASGDIMGDGAEPTAAEKLLSHTIWWHDGRQFEVNSFHHSDRGTWCYELCKVTPDPSRNDYLEVQIPDANPDGGPFVPEPADQVTFTAHGQWDIPWPIFRRFITAIEGSGDIPTTETPTGQVGA